MRPRLACLGSVPAACTACACTLGGYNAKLVTVGQGARVVTDAVPGRWLRGAPACHVWVGLVPGTPFCPFVDCGPDLGVRKRDRRHRAIRVLSRPTATPWVTRASTRFLVAEPPILEEARVPSRPHAERLRTGVDGCRCRHISTRRSKAPPSSQVGPRDRPVADRPRAHLGRPQ